MLAVRVQNVYDQIRLNQHCDHPLIGRTTSDFEMDFGSETVHLISLNSA